MSTSLSVYKKVAKSICIQTTEWMRLTESAPPLSQNLLTPLARWKLEGDIRKLAFGKSALFCRAYLRCELIVNGLLVSHVFRCGPRHINGLTPFNFSPFDSTGFGIFRLGKFRAVPCLQDRRGLGWSLRAIFRGKTAGFPSKVFQRVRSCS